MKTYSPKQSEIVREWYLVDVSGKTLGKVATKLADILRGKNKPTYSPHLDCGDYVVVINAEKIKLSGNKTVDKVYYHHSRYPNGLKAVTAGKLLEDKPEDVITNAVAGMISHNKLKKDILSKLKVYAGENHQHSAQSPKPLDL